MRNKFLILALLAISLFLLLASVSAEDIVADDSSTDIEVQTGEQSVDNSDTANENNDDNSLVAGDDSNDSTQSATSNATNNGSDADSSKVPYKFTSTKNISSTYGKKAKFSVKVLNKEGKAINHTLVTFKVAGKTYNRYTNASGISYIYLNLNAGKYTIKYNATGISSKNIYTVKNYYKITLYKWKSGANVLKNKRIKANVPNSTLVKKIIKLAKSGTPVIKFKGGNGKVVFITAGVHGNEIPSQVAAMKLIKYLQSHPINGTVYVMPFMNPKGTAANVRDYNGVHLNKKANKKGTISYKTVQLIKKFKCDAYGDFHATRPGGKPGKDLVFGSYKPTKKSATIAKYIAKNAKVKYKIYKKAGVEYPGAMEDEVNLKKIPAVTCEVISPHGKIKKGSVSKSLLMMKTLLKYNKII
ncbi:succinylglutamate desuccinylase/aspartoacylase family protein [Methanobrevibacter sp.]|uniref:succinylglutamate desuccinylase/aspartoacylase family protein n=1 Tax=Methanobrevibacter sp. TaxID=66852 RepID=UPI0025E7EE67|nr:succinylglutamate desuccinylase/aspartoacylase family protein [Methanobrevibacter sp.]MBQ2962358.1 succinylglutamate desuccinylase/aspartoacylase family protein [Methanobrevibacter sp.]